VWLEFPGGVWLRTPDVRRPGTYLTPTGPCRIALLVALVAPRLKPARLYHPGYSPSYRAAAYTTHVGYVARSRPANKRARIFTLRDSVILPFPSSGQHRTVNRMPALRHMPLGTTICWRIG